MELQNQEKRLLDLIRLEQEKACREATKQADDQVRQILGEAWRSARERLHEAVERERARAQRQLRLAEAELETRQRLSEQQREALLLDQAWQALEQQLRELWANHDGRRRWIQQAVRVGLQRLPANHWRITHPRLWNAEDQATLSAAVVNGLEQAPELLEDERIKAGIMLRSSGALLDMTLEGLIADRGAIEAELLARIEVEPS